MTSTATETHSVVVERELPYPPEKIWRALRWGSRGEITTAGRLFVISGAWNPPQLDEAQLASWVKQASLLPGERM
jgi:hypothetical protein